MMCEPLPARLKLADEIIDLAGQADAISKSQAVAWFDLNGIILSANQNFLDIFGYTLTEIEGRHHRIFVEPAYAESAEYQQFWSILHDGHFQAAEYKRIGRKGREIWLNASYNPILGFDGRASKVMTIATDVTERKRIEADRAGQINAIAKSQAVIEFALDGTILSANQNFLTIVGYELAELQGKHHRMLVDADDRDSPEYLRFWESLGKGEYHAAEFKRIRKDGGEVWFQATYNPVFGPDGKACKVMKLAMDVTKQKLQANEFAGQAKAIARSQAVIEFDMSGNVLTANQNYLAILGYDLDEIKGRHHLSFVEPGFCETAAYGQFWAALRRGEFQAAEFKRIGKDGREVWLQASYNPVLDLKDSPCKVVKFATDITARKRAETHLVALEAKFLALRDTPDNAKIRLFESIVIHAKDAILITEAEPKDLPGPRIVYANPAFTEMTGYSVEDVAGKSPRILQGPLTGTQARARIKAALKAWQQIQVEIFNYRKNGEGFWVELSIAPVCDEKGQYTHWISVQRDVTARRREQEKLRKSENFLARTATLAGIGGWEIELATGELFFSDETYRIYGLEPGEVLTVDTAVSFFAPEARDTLIAALAACSQDGVP
jgi:methyl-accepting chemotaxis protein